MPARLAQEWRSRGTASFFAWLFSLFLRRKSHILFSLELDTLPQERGLAGIRCIEVHARNFAQCEELRSQLVEINAENRAYLDDVRRGAAVGLALLENDLVVHYAFVLLSNKTSCLLGLPGDAALIGNAYTLPAHRGRGLQAHSALCRARIAQAAGFRTIYCETSPDNLASQRGLEKAGMRRIGRMDLLVLLNGAVLRWRRPAGFRLLGVCLRQRAGSPQPAVDRTHARLS